MIKYIKMRRTLQMEIITYANNDLTMKYLRFGNPEGKAFVVLPGLSLRSVLMAAPAIEAAYKIFCEDPIPAEQEACGIYRGLRGAVGIKNSPSRCPFPKKPSIRRFASHIQKPQALKGLRLQQS